MSVVEHDSRKAVEVVYAMAGRGEGEREGVDVRRRRGTVRERVSCSGG
jgi:hypothetical protein